MTFQFGYLVGKSDFSNSLSLDSTNIVDSLFPNCHHAWPPNWPNAETRYSFSKHYFFISSFLCKLTHLLLSILTSFAILLHFISTLSILNEQPSMHMTRCHVLSFKIRYLSTIEFPTRFSFYLNKPLNCLWTIYLNFERCHFPAENSLTLHLWNKAITLSYLLFLEGPDDFTWSSSRKMFSFSWTNVWVD